MWQWRQWSKALRRANTARAAQAAVSEGLYHQSASETMQLCTRLAAADKNIGFASVLQAASPHFLNATLGSRAWGGILQQTTRAKTPVFIADDQEVK